MNMVRVIAALLICCSFFQGSVAQAITQLAIFNLTDESIYVRQWYPPYPTYGLKIEIKRGGVWYLPSGSA